MVVVCVCENERLDFGRSDSRGSNYTRRKLGLGSSVDALGLPERVVRTPPLNGTRKSFYLVGVAPIAERLVRSRGITGFL